MAKFCVQYRVSGTCTEIIEAESEEAARAMATANVENDEWLPDLEQIDDVDFYLNRMHRVNRGGTILSTTHIRETDVRLDD